VGGWTVAASSHPQEFRMIAFEVKDMSCGHCVGTITKAVTALDGGAKLRIDLASHRVEIEPVAAGAAQLAAAITQAGYSPVRIDTAAHG
jgi:copper chaperone